MLGIDKARDRSSDYACKQQQGDTWPSRPPGDPLRADTKNADQRDCEGLLFHPAFPTIAWAVMSTRNRSEEHTSELQSLIRLSYAVFCLKKKTTHHTTKRHNQY